LRGCPAHSRSLNQLWPLIAILACLLGGCGTTAPLADHTLDPKLASIHTALENVVRACREDQNQDWYSGWTGNMWVNFRKGPARGLCYHWQSSVYEGVLPVVHDVGWEAGGMVINGDTYLEHHVVLVFDPTRIHYDEILETQAPRPVYVLDAWRRGEPDIFTLDDWLGHNTEIAKTAALETPTPVAELEINRATSAPGTDSQP